MRGVFISYRRQDSQSAAGRLADHLKEHLKGVPIFRDVETIEPGVDFIEAINRALESCAILIAVMGPRWLSITDEKGRRRIDDPHDYNRMEVAAALKREDVRVIPVMVEGAQMPATEDLPDELKPLSRRNAIELTDKRWDYDVSRLVETLRRVLSSAESKSEPIATPSPIKQEAAPRMLANSPAMAVKNPAWIAVGVLAAAVVAFLFGRDDSAPTGAATATKAGELAQLADSARQPTAGGEAHPESDTVVTTEPKPRLELDQLIERSPPAAVPAPVPPAVSVAKPSPPKAEVRVAPRAGASTAPPMTVPVISAAAPSAAKQSPAAAGTAETTVARAAQDTTAPAKLASIQPPQTGGAVKPILVVTWGRTSSRSFWSGVDSRTYSQRMAEQFAAALKAQLPQGLAIKQEIDEKAVRDMAVRQSAEALDRACREENVSWVFAAHSQDTFAISTADSAFWPELRLVALRCGEVEPATAKFTLAPRHEDDFPFARELREAMKGFVSERRPGKS